LPHSSARERPPWRRFLRQHPSQRVIPQVPTCYPDPGKKVTDTPGLLAFHHPDVLLPAQANLNRILGLPRSMLDVFHLHPYVALTGHMDIYIRYPYGEFVL
jgi:hypothetical protein